jgi:hypothetical protein
MIGFSSDATMRGAPVIATISGAGLRENPPENERAKGSLGL